MFGSRIICIHAIDENLTLEKFCRYIYITRKLGYQYVSMEEFLKNSSKQRMLTLTIDDAYKSIYDKLLPFLYKEKIPALLFVPPLLLNKKAGDKDLVSNRMYPNESTMSVEEINSWIQKGFQIGFHTNAHTDWSLNCYEKIELDFMQGMSFFKQNNWNTVFFAYPFGNLPTHDYCLTKKLFLTYGIQYAFTLEWKDYSSKCDNFFIPRICLGDKNPLWWSIIKTTGLFDWYGNRHMSKIKEL